jgi:hypothetical protein
MRRHFVAALAFALLTMVAVAAAQRDTNEEPTSLLTFIITKQDNGKPVRNAAVIMHPVNAKGKQERGGLELKTDAEGKANFEGIPYGKLRVQILAKGFQTYGEDFEITQPKVNLEIKLKRPQGQYSIYDDPPSDSSAQPKPDPAPPAEKKNDKPN